MERRGLIIGISAGVGLLIVVCVGFLLPSGANDAPVIEEGSPDKRVSEPVVPRSARRDRPDAQPLRPAPLTQEDKDARRREWSSMTEQQREDFRANLRERLTEARRQAAARQTQIKRREAARKNEMLKQRLAATRIQEGNSPQVNTP